MTKIKLKVPNKLSELTLGQYQKFTKILAKEPDEDFMQKKMIEIFCNVPLDQVNFFKYSSIIKVVEILLDMLNRKPKLRQRFVMNGVEYGIIPDLSDMSFGEFVDLDTYANDWEQMDKALAVLFRPVKSSFKNNYLIKDYTGKETSMSEMPLDVALGAVFFLLNLNSQLMKHTLVSSMDQIKRTNIQQDINSQKSMDGIMHCIRFLDQIQLNTKK